MNRRDLLKQIAMLTGGTMIGAEVFLSGCGTGPKTDAGFTADMIALLDEVGETIIPATTTPGAKAAQVGEFMKLWVTDCYTQQEQTVFMDGIKQLNEACNKMHGHDFMKATAEHRKELLVALEKEAKVVNDKREKAWKEFEKAEREKGNTLPLEFTNPVAPHYYTMIKQMTLHGFFTSKTGATETLRHIQVPGKYDGALPYTKGDKAWASSL
jgi:Gluconate 2-dehydrogenase subunit 3